MSQGAGEERAGPTGAAAAAAAGRAPAAAPAGAAAPPPLPLFEHFVVCGLAGQGLQTVLGSQGFLGTEVKYKPSFLDRLPHCDDPKRQPPPQLPTVRPLPRAAPAPGAREAVARRSRPRGGSPQPHAAPGAAAAAAAAPRHRRASLEPPRALTDARMHTRQPAPRSAACRLAWTSSSRMTSPPPPSTPAPTPWCSQVCGGIPKQSLAQRHTPPARPSQRPTCRDPRPTCRGRRRQGVRQLPRIL
jgi:hypothetical protein